MRITLITLLSLLITMQVSSQDRRDKMKEKLESKKIAYLSDKLNLTPEEAQVFWPLYNEYNAELKAVRKGLRAEHKESMSDTEAADILELYLESQQSEIDTKKKYVDKFKSIMGPIKTLKLWRYERQFKEDMIKQVKRSGMRGNRN